MFTKKIYFKGKEAPKRAYFLFSKVVILKRKQHFAQKKKFFLRNLDKMPIGLYSTRIRGSLGEPWSEKNFIKQEEKVL